MDLASPLEDSIRHELSSRDPAADDWLWLKQHPLAVAKFVKFLEGDNRFVNITSTYILKPLSHFLLQMIGQSHVSLHFYYTVYFTSRISRFVANSILIMMFFPSCILRAINFVILNISPNAA